MPTLQQGNRPLGSTSHKPSSGAGDSAHPKPWVPTARATASYRQGMAASTHFPRQEQATHRHCHSSFSEFEFVY